MATYTLPADNNAIRDTSIEELCASVANILYQTKLFYRARIETEVLF
jgi:hypothetical protein